MDLPNEHHTDPAKPSGSGLLVIIVYQLLLSLILLDVIIGNSSKLILKGYDQTIFLIPPAIILFAFLIWTSRGIYKKLSTPVRWAKRFHHFLTFVGILSEIVFLGFLIQMFYSNRGDRMIGVMMILLMFIVPIFFATLISWVCWNILRKIPVSPDLHRKLNAEIQ